jgi:outer membrane protein assembly factor BamD (BamD/ComL family)
MRTWANITRRLVPVALSSVLSVGCTTTLPWQRSDDTTPRQVKAANDLAAAHELFRAEKYAEAQGKYQKIADNAANPPTLAEEARFFEAESLRCQRYYPKACDTFNKMLTDFPSGQYREQACKRMFEIANYWLDDTRAEMLAAEEQKQGKRWFVLPVTWHFDRTKPTVDEEGRAIQALEHVYYNELTTPLSAQALFLLGRVHYYRGNYRDADHYFTLLAEQHKDHPLAPEAIEMAILAKHLGVGGPDYDGRKSTEALSLVQRARMNYPQMASEKGEFLDRQMIAITIQQAEKDWRTAEFYERTGHPGSAYFYYELIRRRYPNTKYGERAGVKMTELREQAANAPADATNAWDQMFGWMWPAKKKTEVAEAKEAPPAPVAPTTPPRTIPADLAPR